MFYRIPISGYFFGVDAVDGNSINQGGWHCEKEGDNVADWRIGEKGSQLIEQFYVDCL